jgi:hypothetical protein
MPIFNWQAKKPEKIVRGSQIAIYAYSAIPLTILVVTIWGFWLYYSESHRKRKGRGKEEERKRKGRGKEEERKRKGRGKEEERKRKHCRKSPCSLGEICLCGCEPQCEGASVHPCSCSCI